jgi:hypothetical protein
MNKKIVGLFVTIMLVVMVALVSMPVTASFDFDPETGTGFLPKGDVQSLFELNNKELQQNAHLLRASVSTVTEAIWECSKEQNPNSQPRSTTITTSGLVTIVARSNNNGQVTGFWFAGYEGGEPTVATSGPALYSCPSSPNWGFVPGSVSETTVVGGLTLSFAE